MNVRTTVVLLALVVWAAGICVTGCGGGSTSLAHLSARDLFAQGKAHFDNKKYVKSAEYFQSLVYNYPGESIVDTAQYYLALSYYSNKDYELAQAEFNRLLTNYPSSVYAIQAQFMRAVSAFEQTPKNYGLDQTEVEKSIRQFDDFVIDHPESELVPDANKYLSVARNRLAKKFYMAGLTYTRMGASKAATVYYQKVIDDYTDSEFAPLANYQMAEEEMRMHNYDEARRRYENFATVFSQHKLAPKAREKAAEAAFKAAELAYQKRDLAGAAEKFAAFKKDFPNSERARKADEYLAKINQQPSEKSPQANVQPK